MIVESPTKARKIGQFLSDEFEVKASYGHVRQLRKQQGVDPEAGFALSWDLTPRGESMVPELAKALEQAQHLVLATDPDREGEAISWHLMELFKVRCKGWVQG